MPTEIYKKYFREIQDNTQQLLSKDIQIYRMKPYTFVTVIRCNEFSEAEVRLEGMLHFKLCIFLNLRTSEPTHWCRVIKEKYGGVSSCNVWVYYRLQMKLQEGDFFMSVSHSVYKGHASRGAQVQYGIYPPPTQNTDSQ